MTFSSATFHTVAYGIDVPPLLFPDPATTPRKYKYFCWVHGPDMGGEIDVTP